MHNANKRLLCYSRVHCSDELTTLFALLNNYYNGQIPTPKKVDIECTVCILASLHRLLTLLSLSADINRRK